MKKGFEYQFTVSTSTKRKNFAVAYRQNSTIGQSTQTSSHLDSGSLANYQSFFVGAFSKSTEEIQIDEFITSKLSAFDLPVCFTDTTLSLLDKPNNKNITKNSTTLSLIDEDEMISVETEQNHSEFYEESKLSKEFDSESDTF